MALALATTACGDDREASGGPTSGPATTPTTTEATTTTSPTVSTETSTPSTPPPTTVSEPTAHTATAADAVNELRAAWMAGDRERAARIAPGGVVDALFAVPPGGFEVYGCDTGEFATSNCNYRNRSSGAFIKVSATRSDAGWQISTITVT